MSSDQMTRLVLAIQSVNEPGEFLRIDFLNQYDGWKYGYNHLVNRLVLTSSPKLIISTFTFSFFSRLASLTSYCKM